ncbi:hypothetical protein ACJRO7_020541 [Eucalyptus globulus]|uniref:TIR domain-containing protein n=1 Tax=Eucalyptus globulus TaxID=34317 RepID=A0ABD3KH03_EUCGL
MEESSGCDYEVFLSFRGPDTRMDIADYLYVSMVDAGIRAYRDYEELRTGEEIGDQLLQAIRQSKISIPIFSTGYADSPWCLRELVKMVESKNTRGQKIMPIFYNVAPSEVKYQNEHYGNAIVSHLNKKRFNDETINNWKAALKEVGDLKGWDFHSMLNRGKGEFVKEVVDEVLTELRTAYVEVSDCFVKVDNDVDEIIRMIGSQNNETKIVGIHGIGGVGKTTLAIFVYNQLSENFVDNCCILYDMRTQNITNLQKQLISKILKRKSPDINNIMEGKEVIKRRLCSKRVLLLLDDVNDASQLDALMQKREWFGKGSKIIITTQDQGILKVPTLVDGAYELNGMNFNHSLELFSKHAFRRDYPIQQYSSHSNRAVKICGGLPLALGVIGSLLSGKSIEEWDAILKELEKFPQEDVEKKLIISIEALNESQKNIFLDVACFFIGRDKRIVIHMWESCDFCPHQSLPILQQRSLIKIRDDNQLWMHDWLRDIGRNFIRRESDMKLEKQQWVWTYEQALDVLEKTQNGGGFHGNESIKAICLEFDERSRYRFIKEFLASLSNLRFLRVDKKSISQVDSKDFNGDSMSILTQADPFQSYRNSDFLQTPFGQFNLLSELRWLSWNHFPMDMNYELTNFSLRKLVILDLSRSDITEEWDGWSYIKERARKLKVLNLTGCQELCETPDLSFNVNLVQLILEGCRSLVRIHPSISHLKRLVILNLKDCYHLHMLPDEMGELESLEQLLLDSTSVEEIPEWRKAKKLKILSLVECKSLKKFNFVGCATSAMGVDILFTQQPKSIENFNSLTELDLTRSAIQELPDSIGNMKNLRVLKMRNSSIRKLPSAIGMLEKLEELEVGAFAKLRGEIPDNIGKLRFLKRLLVNICGISAAPQLPESLIDLSFLSTSIKMLPLSNLLNLRILNVCSPSITTLSPDISFLSQLEELILHCKNLQCLPRLPTNLSCLWIGASDGWKTTNDLSNLKSLQKLLVLDCPRLTEIRGLEGLQNLRELELKRLPSLAKLPHLTNLEKLEDIRLEDCPELFKLRGSHSWQFVDINLGRKMVLATWGSKHLRFQLQQKEFDPIIFCTSCSPLIISCVRCGPLYP